MKSSHAFILIDDECALCNRLAVWIARYDKQDEFRITGLQSEHGRIILAKYGMSGISLESIIMIEDNQYYSGSNAVMAILKKLNGVSFLRKTYGIMPTSIREKIYRIVANNRYKIFGTAKYCSLDKKIRSKFLT
ncbi:MAG: DUF393 domain-containing protein [Bacteroidetes bacterium]|nr:MAG: DUF393 domain-containing protein [Bacteroidota bacterium]REK06637.1 MAG: DUF393 domain-containing protein [Bacteroidota bacterium]REK33403.1 MAG: DUF393 domain-containing protein [Bacteroidota bacterium]REK49801.1 MAG: DUF393 domain-containing protein [Bacteroidota bacterium]